MIRMTETEVDGWGWEVDSKDRVVCDLQYGDKDSK